MEEMNKQKRMLVAKTIAARRAKTMTEAAALNQIQVMAALSCGWGTG
jgi:hypothetical protein